jgi:hypothetical protein
MSQDDAGGKDRPLGGRAATRQQAKASRTICRGIEGAATRGFAGAEARQMMDERFVQHGRFWEALIGAKAAQSPERDLDDIAVSLAILIAGIEVETLRVRNMRFRVAEYLAFVLVDRPDLLVEASHGATSGSNERLRICCRGNACADGLAAVTGDAR